MIDRELLESYGVKFKGCICPEGNKNGFCFTTYGGEVSMISYKGVDIEDLFPEEVSPCGGQDDDLGRRLSEKLEKWIIEIIKEEAL